MTAILKQRFGKFYNLFAREYRRAARTLLAPRYISFDGIKVDTQDPNINPRLRQQLRDEDFELQVRDILNKTLTPNDIVLELGGGFGVVTSKICQIVGDKNTTTCEATPQMREALGRTLKLNGYNPTVHQGIFGEQEGETEFQLNTETFWSSSQSTRAGEENTTSIKVPVIDGPALCRKLKPTYLVVDIEGAEDQLTNIVDLASVRTICLETHPQVARIRNVLPQLMEAGFDVDTLYSAHRCLVLRRQEDLEQTLSIPRAD